MHRSEKEKESSPNVTKERLAGTPFDKAELLKRTQAEILEQEWRVAERCRIRRELLEREEFKDNLKPLRDGVNFGYSDVDGDLFKVFLDQKKGGVRIAFDENRKSEEDSSFIGATIQSVFEPFYVSFLRVTGVMSPDERDSAVAAVRSDLAKDRTDNKKKK